LSSRKSDLVCSLHWSQNGPIRFDQRGPMTRSVLKALRQSLPHLSLRAQAIVDALLLTGGSLGSADELAPHVGLRSRFDVARLLKREGLPPLHHLAGWASTLVWLDTAEQTGSSLCSLAFRSRRDPATCYRMVKRITGKPWREVRRQGSRWLVERFAERLSRFERTAP
jgi:hypothetical protein